MIIGLTDKPLLRRDGKIRAGKKEGSNLVNSPNFLLHDAPELEGSIGAEPTEIFFTVHSDNPHDFMKSDLRWYNASQLLCMSMHNAPDEQGNSLGSVAAYSGVGSDVSALQQRPFPRMQRARVRACNYKGCDEYKKNMCTEHMFLDVIVPQCSMGAVFTLDSTSINAIMNAHSTFSKAHARYGGKLSGQIYRMYKDKGEIQYQKKDGSTGKREAPMVYFDIVNFEDYEKNFKDKVRPEDWAALLSLRSRTSLVLDDRLALPAPEEAQQLGTSQATNLIGSGPAIDPVLTRANDPILQPLFQELGALVGKEPTEELRYATVKNFASVKEVATYLKGKIKEAGAGKAKKATEADVAGAAKTKAAQDAGAQQSGGALY
jgi:hypothetical protein